MKFRAFSSLSVRMTLFIVLTTINISIATLLIGYRIFSQSVENSYVTLGRNMVQTTKMLIDVNSIDMYLSTGMKDKAYDETLALLRRIAENTEMRYIYVVRATPDGLMFVYDTDEKTPYPLGYVEPWQPDYIPLKPRFLEGKSVPPIISLSSFGWLLSIHEPIKGDDGQVKGYMSVDIPLDLLTNAKRTYLGSLTALSTLAACAFAFTFWYIIRRMVVKPVNQMAKAANAFLIDKTRNDALASLNVQTNDELQSLAEALKTMELKLEEYLQSLNEANWKASTDPLTKLHNRDAFCGNVDDFLRKNRSPGKMHAFMVLDVDHFKSINDTYGHAIGDEVLIQCAEILSGLFRDSDDVGRIGGDEFAVFCKSVGSVAMVEQKVRRLKCAFTAVRPVESANPVTASIGIAMVFDEPTDYKTVFQKADGALYLVKAQGRDGYAIYDDDKVQQGR